MATDNRNSVVEQDVEDRFLTALTCRDFATLATCFGEDARFRALLPRGLREATGGGEPASYFQQWFGAADQLDLLDSRTDAIADRHHMSWRFRVQDQMGWRVIEQQAFATIRDGQFAEFDLLCSGFRAEDPRQKSTTPELDDTEIPVAAVLEGGEANCATLTPLIKEKLRELGSGQVLAVITSEPTADQDILSWSNLTGNVLVGMRSNGAERRFYVRKT